MYATAALKVVSGSCREVDTKIGEVVLFIFADILYHVCVEQNCEPMDRQNDDLSFAVHENLNNSLDTSHNNIFLRTTNG